MLISKPVDIAVVGAGVVGLTIAARAHELGMSVALLDRDTEAVGASVRNFGHICATAQSGLAFEYARVARDMWVELGRKANFDVNQCGTLVLARADDELALLEEFRATREDGDVRLLDVEGVDAHLPVHGDGVVGGAMLPFDLRLDPRQAIPALASWLADLGVTFHWGTNVGAIEPGVVQTSRGLLHATHIVHCSGHDIDQLFPDVARAHEVRRCRLQMLEVAPPGGMILTPALLTGTSMLRYGGMASMPAAADVEARLRSTKPELFDVAMNLMVTQRPDGAIVLGDTHHYAITHSPFDDEELALLLLREGSELFGLDLQVTRRWRGVYADSPNTNFVNVETAPGVRIVSVTSGIGMTTAPGLARAVVDEIATSW